MRIDARNIGRLTHNVAVVQFERPLASEDERVAVRAHPDRSSPAGRLDGGDAQAGQVPPRLHDRQPRQPGPVRRAEGTSRRAERLCGRGARRRPGCRRARRSDEDRTVQGRRRAGMQVRRAETRSSLQTAGPGLRRTCRRRRRKHERLALGVGVEVGDLADADRVVAAGAAARADRRPATQRAVEHGHAVGTSWVTVSNFSSRHALGGEHGARSAWPARSMLTAKRRASRSAGSVREALSKQTSSSSGSSDSDVSAFVVRPVGPSSLWQVTIGDAGARSGRRPAGSERSTWVEDTRSRLHAVPAARSARKATTSAAAAIVPISRRTMAATTERCPASSRRPTAWASSRPRASSTVWAAVSRNCSATNATATGSSA